MKNSLERLRKYAPNYINRSIPYIKFLVRSANKSRKNYNRSDLLRKFPKHVTDDIIEILYNIVMGNLPSSKRNVTKLKAYEKPLLHLINLPSKRNRRSYIYKQRGGFISTLIPIIASLVGAITSNVLSKT